MRFDPDDPAARVEFVFRGDPNGKFTLPIEARPKTWVRGLNVGGVAGLVTGVLVSGPVAYVAPGPVGVLATAFLAVAGGVTSALTLGRVIADADTPERPLRHRLRAARTELRTPRPQPGTIIRSDLTGIWPVTATTRTLINPRTWSPCVHPDCVAPPPSPPDPDSTARGDRRPREPHRRPRRHVGVLRPRRLRARRSRW